MARAAFLLSFAFALLCLAGRLFPAGQLGTAGAAVSQLCGMATDLLPPLSMLLVLAGAIIYAAGQLMGAETRARAIGWASACIIGAVVGTLIVSISPSALGAIYGGEVACLWMTSSTNMAGNTVQHVITTKGVFETAGKAIRITEYRNGALAGIYTGYVCNAGTSQFSAPTCTTPYFSPNPPRTPGNYDYIIEVVNVATNQVVASFSGSFTVA